MATLKTFVFSFQNFNYDVSGMNLFFMSGGQFVLCGTCSASWICGFVSITKIWGIPDIISLNTLSASVCFFFSCNKMTWMLWYQRSKYLFNVFLDYLISIFQVRYILYIFLWATDFYSLNFWISSKCFKNHHYYYNFSVLYFSFGYCFVSISLLRFSSFSLF